MTYLHAVSAPEPNASIEERFRDAMLSLQGPWDEAYPHLDQLYATDVSFRDSMFRANNKFTLLRANKVLIRIAKEVRVEVESVVVSGDQLFATWRFDYTPRLGPTIRVEGCSHARVLDGQIVSQRDYWDIIGSAVGSLVDLVKRRRAS